MLDSGVINTNPSYLLWGLSQTMHIKVPKTRSISYMLWLPVWLSDKASACQCRRHKRWGFNPWIPGSGRFPRGGNGNLLQYLCLENSMNRGAWWAKLHGGHKDSNTTEQTCTYVCCTIDRVRYWENVNFSSSTWLWVRDSLWNHWVSLSPWDSPLPQVLEIGLN